MTRILICLTIILCAACQPHLVIKPPALPHVAPHMSPWPSLLPTITPAPGD